MCYLQQLTNYYFLAMQEHTEQFIFWTYTYKIVEYSKFQVNL